MRDHGKHDLQTGAVTEPPIDDWERQGALRELTRLARDLEREDADTKETHQLALNMAAGGIGSVYTYSIKPENRTIFAKQWQLRFTKEGESFATAKKQTRPPAPSQATVPTPNRPGPRERHSSHTMTGVQTRSGVKGCTRDRRSSQSTSKSRTLCL